MLDAHRHALNDLREVAGRVLRREQGELRAGAGREARHRAVQALSPGSASTLIVAGWPARMRPICVSLKFAVR